MYLNTIKYTVNASSWAHYTALFSDSLYKILNPVSPNKPLGFKYTSLYNILESVSLNKPLGFKYNSSFFKEWSPEKIRTY